MQLPHIHPSKNAPHESSRYIVITETSTRCKFDAFPRDCRYLPGRNHLFLPPPLPVWKTRNRISLEPAWQSFESMPRLTIERASISRFRRGCFQDFLQIEQPPLIRSHGKETICPSRMETRGKFGGEFILCLRLGDVRVSFLINVIYIWIFGVRFLRITLIVWLLFVSNFLLKNKLSLSIAVCKIRWRFSSESPPFANGICYGRGIFLLIWKKFYEKM